MTGRVPATVDGLTIRPARLDEGPVLARLQVRSYRTAYAGILPSEYLQRFDVDEQAQEWAGLLSIDPEPLVLVAEAGAEAIGYALGRQDTVSLLPQGTGPSSRGTETYDSELVALHVRRDWQRRGVGRALLAAMAAALGQRGASSLMLWVLAANKPGRAFYERCGGVLVGAQETVFDDRGTRSSEVAYGWQDIGILRSVGRRVDE